MLNILHSGNLTIQLSDLLFQFVILEGFYKDILLKRPIFLKEILEILVNKNLMTK